MKLRAIAEVAAYFPFVNGWPRVERGPRSRYWREYAYRRYHTDPEYRARRLATGRRSKQRRRAA